MKINYGDRPNSASSDVYTFTKDESEGHNLTAVLAFDDLEILSPIKALVRQLSHLVQN